MSDLIKINYDTDQPTVSARDLHEGLEIKTELESYTWKYINKHKIEHHKFFLPG